MKGSLFLLVATVVLCSMRLGAQETSFNYSQQLLEVQDKWHEVILTPNIVNKCKFDFSDLRVKGVKDNNDTLEYPYIVKRLEEEKESLKIKSEIINRTTRNGFSFLTIHNSSSRSINKIIFETNQSDYNIYLSLEGSNDNSTWFKIEDSLRIAGITMDGKNYMYNDIVFEKSNFKYFRISYKTKEKFSIKSASTYWQKVNSGQFYNIEINSQFQEEKDGISYLEIDFEESVSISQITLNVDDDIDYFRNVTLSNLADSTIVNGQVKYQYIQFNRSHIKSWGSNIIKFRTRKMSNLRIAIFNADNQPLSNINVNPKLCKTSLTIRTNDKAQYYLAYGNKEAKKPNYDIQRFKDKIPLSLKQIHIDPNVKYHGDNETSHSIQKYWLWLVLFLVVFVIGGATVYMMKNKE